MDRLALDAALGQARKSLAEGGIPIGAALVDPDGVVVALGHNLRVQSGDPTAHAETDNGAPQERFLLDYPGAGTTVVTDPADYDPTSPDLAALHVAGKPVEFRLRFLCGDGKWRWMLQSTTPRWATLPSTSPTTCTSMCRACGQNAST